MNSPLKWHGGKHYLAPKLIPYLPTGYITRVHPYAGGLSELFAWPCEGISEIVNDTNEELTNFWSVLRDASEYFVRAASLTPFSENEFNAGAKYSRALAFFVKIRQSRQGLGKEFATLSVNRTRRGMNEQVSSWLSAVEGLPDVCERLRRVVILNRPALEVIRKYDGPNTFFYLDPPYVHDSRSTKTEYGENEMSDQDHIKLLETLESVKGRFMLSGYPSRLYEVYAPRKWQQCHFSLPNNASSAKAKERKTECIWMNY